MHIYRGEVVQAVLLEDSKINTIGKLHGTVKFEVLARKTGQAKQVQCDMLLTKAPCPVLPGCVHSDDDDTACQL